MALLFAFAGTVRAAVGDTLTGITAEGDAFVCVVTDETAKTAQVGDGKEACMDNVARSVTLPACVGGYRITAVAAGAFGSLIDITAVSLPDGIVSIGAGAFSGDRSITAIRLPSTLQTIGEGGLANMQSLREVVLPEGVNTIGAYGIANNKRMTRLHIPASVSTIDDYAFRGNTSLTDATFAEGCTISALPMSLFQECKTLKTLTLPATVQTVGNYCFDGCASLRRLNWDDLSLRRIEAGAFSGTAFTDIAFAETLEAVGVRAFADCPNLSTVRVENVSPAECAATAFDGSWDKASLIVPQGSLFAYFDAAGWMKFKNITQWQDLAEGATFTGYTLKGNRMTCVVRDASARTCVIGNGTAAAVNAVEKGIFSLPVRANGYTIVGIAAGAFANQTAITQVVMKGETPPALDAAAFPTGMAEKTRLYVPAGSVGSYAEADGWRSFLDIGEDLPMGTVFHRDTEEGVAMAFQVLDDEARTLAVVNEGDGNSAIDNAYEGKITVPIHLNGHDVTTIGDDAFAGSMLTEVVLPEGISHYGQRIFSWCGNLSAVTLAKDMKYIPRAMFQVCRNLRTITLPEGLDSIGAYAFFQTRIAYLTLPASLKRIGGSEGRTFDQVPLEFVVALGDPAAVPNTNTFSTYGRTVIRTPLEKVDAYRAADVWKQFARIEGTAAGCPVTAEYFPDDNLRQKIQSLYGDRITYETASTVTELNLARLGIGSARGLEYFPNLRRLWINDNSLRELDMRSNPFLEELYCQRNQLDTIVIERQFFLKTFDASHNNLRQIDLTDCPAFTTLLLNDNRLEALWIWDAREIDTLNVAHNRLARLNMNRNEKLVYVDCSYNQLAEAFAGYSPNLRVMKMNHNNITAINVRDNQHLDTLIANNNSIKNVYAPRNGRLRVLNVAYNNVDLLDLSGQDHLNYIDARANAIIATTLPKAGTVETLYIQNNLLTALDLSAQTRLCHLQCGNNSLGTLALDDKDELETLSCPSCNLTAIALAGKQHLTSADISGNLLNGVSVSGCTKLEDFDCSGNNLRTISLADNAELQRLNVANNRLESLDLAANTRLTALTANNNQLWNVDLSAHTQLQQLNLSVNQLTTVDLSRNTNLTVAGDVNLTNQQVIGELIMAEGPRLGVQLNREAAIDDFSEVVIGGKDVTAEASVITTGGKSYLLMPIADPNNAGKVISYKYNPHIPNLPDKRLEVKYAITGVTGITPPTGSPEGEGSGNGASPRGGLEGADNAWYTLDGQQLDGVPTQHGVYIHKGKKVVVK